MFRPRVHGIITRTVTAEHGCLHVTANASYDGCMGHCAYSDRMTRTVLPPAKVGPEENLRTFKEKDSTHSLLLDLCGSKHLGCGPPSV